MLDASNTQLPPPKYWQQFETLCWDLWKNIWAYPETQKNGRVGQPQNGVDIYGRLNDSHLWAGIQCKLKSDWESGRLTCDEINKEVEKAKSFVPRLSKFIIATTAKKDGNAEAIARNITQQHLADGLFSVTIMFWDDILDRFSDYPILESKYFSFFARVETEEGKERTILDYINRENKKPFSILGTPLLIGHLNYFVWSLFGISVMSLVVFLIITVGEVLIVDPIITIAAMVLSIAFCGLSLKAFSYFGNLIYELRNSRFLHIFTFGTNIELDKEGFVWLTRFTGDCPACGSKLSLQYEPSEGYLFLCSRNKGHWWGFDYTEFPI